MALAGVDSETLSLVAEAEIAAAETSGGALTAAARDGVARMQELAAAYVAYRDVKRRERMLDATLAALRGSPAAAASVVGERYQNVIVDDAQHMSMGSLAIAAMLASRSQSALLMSDDSGAMVASACDPSDDSRR